MPMPPTHTHTARTCTYTDKLACIHECLCVCVEPPLAVSPTALLLLLLLPSLSCERASVFVDFGVYVGQQQQQQQQPNSGPWLRVYGARATFGRNSLKHTHTHMYTRKHTHSHTDTERSPAALCMCSLSLVALGCCCHCHLLLLLPFLCFALSFAAIRSNSDKCGHFLLHFFLHMQVERALCARMRDREFVQ